MQRSFLSEQDDSRSPTTKIVSLRRPCEQRLLSDRYQLRRLLGRGQIADVYLGDDVLLERVVAIKIPHQSVIDDEPRLSRFRRDAVALAAIHSPHVVGIYDIGLMPGGIYLVMQHIDGPTIEQEIAG